MQSKSSAALVACMLIVAGCGAQSDTAEAQTPSDAEAPYASAAIAPSHNDTQTAPNLDPDAHAVSAAFNEATADVDAHINKVGNVTAAADDDARADMKKLAAAKDEDGSVDEAAGGLGALVGDDARGKRLYGQCQACHAVVEGQNRVGPSLYGIVGRQAGTVDGFRYSEANANADLVWTEDALFGFLEDPRGYMPGTRMIFLGVAKPQDRADIIAYLTLQTDQN